MGSIVELIKLIERRPAMYLSKIYICCLKSYLDGYMYSMDSDVYEKSDAIVLSDFQTWIEKKHPISDSHSWSDIILFFSEGETDALKKFFLYFNEWLIKYQENKIKQGNSNE